jgi:uncharacterized protein YggE
VIAYISDYKLNKLPGMRRSIVFIALFLLFATPQFGQTKNPSRENTLIVKGIAILKQTPEILSARITIKESSEKYNQCQEKLVRAIDQANRVFVKNGIGKKTIQISDLNISEKKDYLPDGGIKTSFEGTSTLLIENSFSAEYSKKMLSALQNDSLSMLYNLDFILSETQKKELRQKAIANAVADAREKAEAIAAASNVRLLNIKSINFTDDEMGRFYESDLVQENVLFARENAFSKAGSQLPVIDFNPKEIGIKKSVTIEWWIEDVK